jgi:transcriptional regulator with XRE-family HTH domain
MAIKTSYDAEELRVWRARENLTAKEAADLLGVSRGTLWAWEAGRYPRDLMERMEKAKAIHAARQGVGAPARAISPDAKANLKAAKRFRLEEWAKRAALMDVDPKGRATYSLANDYRETHDEALARIDRETIAKFGITGKED